MELIRRIEGVRQQACVITLGSFDGLHTGHRALIERAQAHARRRGLSVMLLTFEPMPREFLQAADPPARLTNFRERWRLLADSGIERVCVLSFNERLRRLSGLQFMELLRAAGARAVVIGHDFRFGCGGEANAQWCAAHAMQFGFETDVVEPVCLDSERISSRQVRVALAASDFARAQRLLGRPYAMRGRVRVGDHLGRQLGFATANVPVRRRRVPLQGIFAVRVQAPGVQHWPGVASLGVRPTVGGSTPLLEAHLFDFDGDLYGREIEVEFVAKLRDEEKFASLDLMVEQMRRDAQLARGILGV